jgi:hypothetical protein
MKSVGGARRQVRLVRIFAPGVTTNALVRASCGSPDPNGDLSRDEHLGFTKQRTSVTLIKDLTDQ